MMTRQEMEDAIKVAQVTYLLEGGRKETMVTEIPETWFPELHMEPSYVLAKVSTPRSRSRSPFENMQAAVLKDVYLPIVKAHLEDSTPLLKLMDKQK